MNRFALLGSIALTLMFSGVLRADTVSMLDETREIECKFKDGPYDSLKIDRKDTKLILYKSGKSVTEYERTKFLDRAILLKAGDANKAAVFQIFMNNEILFSEGQKIGLLEKNCDDTGASKTCKTDQIKKFFWSPEKLELDAGTQKFAGSVDNYGYLANHATYFRARDKKGNALTLIDYGSELEMIVGRAWPVTCAHSPAIEP